MNKIYFLTISSLILFGSLNFTKAGVYTTGSDVDEDGNLVIVGFCIGTFSIFNVNFDVISQSGFIIKLDHGGDLIWYKILSGNSKIQSVSINNYDIYLTGESNGNAFVARYNQLGEIQWFVEGTSSNNSFGIDICTDSSNNVYAIGNGGPISFGAFYANGKTFLVKFLSDGTITGIFNCNLTQAQSVAVDESGNLLVSGSDTNGPYYEEVLTKFNNDGSVLWRNAYSPLGGGRQSILIDNKQNISVISRGSIRVFNPNGLILKIYNFATAGVGLDIKNDDDFNFVFTGFFASQIQFGDTTLTSNGFDDAFIVKTDSSFVLEWVKCGGGISNDQLNSIEILNDGNIIATGNFCGDVTFDNYQLSGGLSENDNWIATIKLDQNGNLIWFKKIAGNNPQLNEINWFPLEIGNRWQYFQYKGNLIGYQYALRDVRIIDSIYINGKKFFNITGFTSLPSAPYRFDESSAQIKVYLNNQEHTLIDFNKLNGENFPQIQANGSYSIATIISQTINILSNQYIGKGFHLNIAYNGLGKYLFAQDIGFAYQDEEMQPTNWMPYPPEIDLELIECILFNMDSIIHKKHNYSADIQFNPVTFLPDTMTLEQNFIIDHHYSIPSHPNYYITGVSYIDSAMFESYYSNNNDTIFNFPVRINPITEKEFSLNISIDTNLYYQGYHLFYRIMAKDKGIIPSYYYKPEEGYYKLYWRDSASSVIQIENFSFDYSLYQNYPNPFNPKTNIEFSIKERVHVELKVYDILGNEIVTLIDEELQPGKYKSDFTRENLSSGIYIYQLRARDFVKSHKMIYLK